MAVTIQVKEALPPGLVRSSGFVGRSIGFGEVVRSRYLSGRASHEARLKSTIAAATISQGSMVQSRINGLLLVKCHSPAEASAEV